MIAVLNLIKSGIKTIDELNPGRTFEKYLTNNESEYYMIIPNVDITDALSIEKLMRVYHIQGIFELSNCYLQTNSEQYTLWHITKDKPDCIRTAVCNIPAHPYHDGISEFGSRKIPDRYNDEYLSYINCIEKWTKTGIVPKDKKGICEFNEVPETEYDYTKPYASFYRKSNNEIRKKLRTECVVSLEELATVIEIHLSEDGLNGNKSRCLDPKKASYPYSPELQSIDYYTTSERILKGDIVQLSQNKYFLVDKESDFDLYPLKKYIIRAREICPEYLYFYLNSDVANSVYNALLIQTHAHSKTKSWQLLEAFPIIMPKENEEYYRDMFRKISVPDTRYYIEAQKDTKSLECALINEMIEGIKLNNDRLLRELIEKDFEELNKCLNDEAYKATLVMAGAILEAFLIDWLTELRGISFTDDLKKYQYDYKNKRFIKNNGEYIFDNSEHAKPSLFDYIKEIEDRKTPNWSKEAACADEIRDMRNMIHPRHYYTHGDSITKEKGERAIKCLKCIIDSRMKQ